MGKRPLLAYQLNANFVSQPLPNPFRLLNSAVAAAAADLDVGVSSNLIWMTYDILTPLRACGRFHRGWGRRKLALLLHLFA